MQYRTTALRLNRLNMARAADAFFYNRSKNTKFDCKNMPMIFLFYAGKRRISIGLLTRCSLHRAFVLCSQNSYVVSANSKLSNQTVQMSLDFWVSRLNLTDDRSK